tara:strand:+ start:24810 stop:26534 length:1725 start_codon:yes stop_codon:yes gene_type:complete
MVDTSNTKPTNAMDYLTRRMGSMRSERSSWDSHWQDLMDNFSPRRGKFLTTDRNRGNKRNTLSNNTPLFARRVLVSGLMTGITSPARPWFRLTPPDPEMDKFGPARKWLDECERLMYKIFASSNLYKALPLIYEESGVVGTSAMIQEDDFDTVTRFTNFTAGEYYLDINGKLKVDTFSREYEMTVYQLVDEFGYENCSKTVQNLYDVSNYGSWIKVNHVIEPVSNMGFDEFQLDAKFKWRSIYYEPGRDGLGTDKNKFLRVKGYENFPILAPRWDAKAGDIYGFSPGMDALGDSRALQVQEREKGKAVAKMVAPPTTAPSSLKNSNISLLPGANNFSDDPNNIFRPIYQVNPRVNELSADIQLTEDRINRAFYVDLFLLISRQDDIRTATEISARQEEKLLQLGPVLEGMHEELLDPLVDNTFARIMRLSEAGWKDESAPQMLPPPPDEMMGSEIKVDYISVLAQAQKLVSTGAMERWVGFTGQVAGLKPEVLDKINADKVVEQMATDLGVPNDLVVGEEQVNETRQARMKQAENEKNLQNMQMMTEGVKGLSDMDTTAGNALGDIVGGMTGGA